MRSLMFQAFGSNCATSKPFPLEKPGNVGNPFMKNNSKDPNGDTSIKDIKILQTATSNTAVTGDPRSRGY